MKKLKSFIIINSIATFCITFLLLFFLSPKTLNLPRIKFLNDGGGGDHLTGEITSILFLIFVIGLFYLFNTINLFQSISKKQTKKIFIAIGFMVLLTLILIFMYNFVTEAPLYV